MSDDLWYEFRNLIWAREFERAYELLAVSPDLIERRSGLGETVLHYLAVENDAVGVKWLYERGSSLNTKNEFGTPIVFEVAQLEYKDLLLWFVGKGVDLKATNEEGEDVFAYLANYDKKEMIDFLRSQTS